MKFIDKMRRELGLSKAEMARALGRSPQSYRSLERAREALLLTDLQALRKLVSDTRLLDEVEREIRRKRIKAA